ncbi:MULTISPECIES: hemolysin family protein [Flavobacteriaceae]|uniref:HlyC/CorC family transporter n=2 Tax=Flavobacteriaceae TaxID=49546 RepID=A0A4Y8AV00_9FLAO|nr:MULTISPECIES: hemolysin family protein [Flavobacteriaceae]TEW75186.1 HlyC/CorC family transporter [Gramella jeungdoensis]GGK40863.1 hemolysin [Lutibacter litoralis]
MEFQIAVILISILLSAFFSGMEIAYVSANKFQVELEKRKEGFTSKILSRITLKSSKFITTMLVGNNIALVVYSFFMGELIIGFIPDNTFNEFSILLIQTVISTLIILITAEFLPKALFRIYANETLWFFAPLAYFFYIIFHFISSFITVISDFFLRFFFNSTKDEKQSEFTKVELGHYISKQLENAKDFEEVDSEIQIFQNALEFDTVKAREIMIPRTEVVAVDINESITNLKNLFIKTGYSKILIYKNSLDDVLGYVHAFELFKKPKNIKSIILPVEFVPESMMINNVLNILTKKKRSLSVVLDEFGGTSGVITVEDIVEELFGEIIDEHDTVELLENKINDREFEFSARLEVDYLNETYNLNIKEDEAYETLGGYIVNYNEDIPKEGEIIEIDNLYFKMLKVGSSKIMEVYLKVLDKAD